MTRRPRLLVQALEDRVTPTAGALDRAFATDGVATLAALKSAVDIAPTADGGVVVLGVVATGTGDIADPTADFGVVKLTASGTIDRSFGVAGLATVGFNLQADGMGPDLPHRVVVRPDGGIVVLGVAVKLATPPSSQDVQEAVAVLTPAGVLDPAFDGDGKLTFHWVANPGDPGTGLDAVALPDNTVVLAEVVNDAGVQTFVATDPTAFLRSGGLDRTGGGGTLGHTPTQRLVASARLTAAGAFDPTYGGGKAFQVVGTGDAGLAGGPRAVGLGPDGAVVAAYAAGTTVFALRVKPDGSRDAGFGPAGAATVGDLSTSNGPPTLVRPTADGKVLIVFDPGTTTHVTRFLGTGATDLSYGTAGTFTVAAVTVRSATTPPYLKAADAVALSDGRLLLGGTMDGISPLLRLTAAGTPDPTFNGDGYATKPHGFDAPPSNYPSAAAAVRPTANGTRLYVLPPFVPIAGQSPTVTRTLAEDSQNTPPTLEPLPDLTETSDAKLFRSYDTVLTARTGDAETLNDLRLTFSSSSPLAAFTPVLKAYPYPKNGLSFFAFPGPDGSVGSATITVTVTDAGGLTASRSFTLTRTAVATPPAVPNLTLLGVPTTAVGGADGTVRVVTAGKAGAPVTPFAGFAGGVRVASADVNGDGTPDTVVGTGPGSATHLRVLDGKTGAELFAMDPFEASFTGGVFVAAGDVNGDGTPDLIVSPDGGGGARVRVFSGKGFGQLADFFGIDDPAFRGGARVAAGDLDGDGVADLVVSAGPGGGPRVAVFDGKSNFARKLVGDFFAFEDALRGGVFPAVGDLDGDGRADLVVGAGPGGGPRVVAFAGRDLLATPSVQTRLADFFAGDPARRDGVRVAAKDLDGDARADLVVAVGPTVSAYSGKGLKPGPVAADLSADMLPGLAGGVFVG